MLVDTPGGVLVRVQVHGIMCAAYAFAIAACDQILLFVHLIFICFLCASPKGGMWFLDG
jgi:hypothetical protein